MDDVRETAGGAYPLHDKLRESIREAHAIGDFLDWIESRGWYLAEWNQNDRLQEVYDTPSKIVGEFLEIDPVGLEAEKQLMLRELLARPRSIGPFHGDSGIVPVTLIECALLVVEDQD